MSTRSVIARVGKSEGEFTGVYHHSDGYPSGLGAALVRHLHGHFKNDLKKMLRVLIDEHCAWSCIVGKNFRLKPGFSGDYKKTNPACYCHGTRSEKVPLYTQKNLEGGTDIEWVYAFDEELNRMYVRDVRNDSESIVDLAEVDPPWGVIECGENFERCQHYAYVHGLTPQDCNLSTQTWLGNQPLDFHDAIAFIVNGKRWQSTGNGGDSDFYNTALARRQGFTKRFPPRTWVANLKAKNGKRIDVAVATHSGHEYAPLPGVTWIFPPTKDNPAETMEPA